VSPDDPDLFREADAEGPPRSPVWQRVVIGVVAVVYLVTAAQGAVVVIGDLFGWATEDFITFGVSDPSTGRQELRDDVLGPTVRAVCIAAVGVVLGLWWRRRPVLAVSGAAVVVALVVGLTTYALAAEDQPERSEWEDRPRACQEHSGGDTRCPGG
jgi:hypothetical protein